MTNIYPNHKHFRYRGQILSLEGKEAAATLKAGLPRKYRVAGVDQKSWGFRKHHDPS